MRSDATWQLRLQKAQQKIEEVDPLLYRLLESYYIKGKSWQEIATANYYSIENIFKLRKKAISLLEKIESEEIKNV